MAKLKHLAILQQGVGVWNEWRAKHQSKWCDLDDADLRNANLQEADFSLAGIDRADLRFANMSGATFATASLRGSKLFSTNLSRACFQEAFLKHAYLRRAILADASLADVDFSGADLTRADFSNADFSGVDFSNAKLGYTVLAGVDLSEVKGLDTVTHAGPSSIGIDTLYKSRGQIPEQFLRGAGVPNEVIEIARSLRNDPPQWCSCFISYSHEDKAFADLLYERLQAQGIRCWKDEHQLLPGDDLHEGIDRGIRLWDKVLLCASKSSLTSWWVDGEINRAFQKEAQIMKERGKKVLALIPLNLDGFLFSADYQSGKKAEITSRVAANFVGWEKGHALFDRELDKVIRALRTEDTGREKPPSPRL